MYTYTEHQNSRYWLIPELFEVLAHKNTLVDPTPTELRNEALIHNEAQKSARGPLSYVSADDCKGRSQLSTYVVDDNEGIDWDRMIGMPRETFEELWEYAMDKMERSDRVYLSQRSIGADPLLTMPVTVVSNSAVSSLFAQTLLRPAGDTSESPFKANGLVMLSLPWERIELSELSEKHIRSLSYISKGQAGVNDKAIIMDMEHNIALILGDSYNGPQKKTPYTMYNYALTKRDILPMHCSANVGGNTSTTSNHSADTSASGNQDTTLYFGLSGTGKTTLSADPNRPLVGDDEHGWGPQGIFNFENGCYAKTIGITEETEPEIFQAAYSQQAIVENVPMEEDGSFDFFDTQTYKTANGRVAYPLSVLDQLADQVVAKPKNIFILSYDAFGVLPPISKLNNKQAMLYFLSGFTSKVSGTENGITKPEITFSPCLGGPFFANEPLVYARLFGQQLHANPDIQVWFMNTGNNGHKERMSLTDTRAIMHAALQGELNSVSYVKDDIFGLETPTSCPGVDPSILQPQNSWESLDKYRQKAKELAALFKKNLLNYSPETVESFKDVCPGF